MQPYVFDAARRKLASKVLPHRKAGHSDLAAAIGVGAVVVQLLFAQLTLALTIGFLVTDRLSRWRHVWLALPAVTGLAWTLAIGVKPAFAGFLAAGGKVVSVLAGHGTLPARLTGLSRVPAAWRHWLPGQLPLAMLAASAQAAALRLARPVRSPVPAAPGTSAAPGAGYRPGILTILRHRYLIMTLGRGEFATADGCCVGVIGATGRRATISWAEAEAGVLCTGEPSLAVTATGLVLTVAAIQHRKSVIAIDLTAGQQRAWPGADPIAAACADLAAPLREFGRSGMHYDPLSGASPAKATNLVMAMVDWTGVPHAEQLGCASYLNAALSVIGPPPSAGVLADLISMLQPDALRKRLALRPGQQAGQVAASKVTVSEVTASKVAELLSRIESDPAILTRLRTCLATLASDPVAAWLRPSPSAISLGRALAGREVVHFQLGRPRLGPPGPPVQAGPADQENRPAGSAVMIARLVVADLIDNLMWRGDAGYRGDSAVWINGCEMIDSRQLSVLIALGERTGTAVLLGTADASAAARLAAEVNVVAARGSVPGEIGVDGLPALLAAGQPEQLALSVQRPVARLAACVAVR